MSLFYHVAKRERERERERERGNVMRFTEGREKPLYH
jgi:hypothetical protein